MGASCGKESSGDVISSRHNSTHEQLSTVMFRRVDKGGKGYLDLADLQGMMQDSKAHFQGKDAQHILSKYGSGNNRMSPKEFHAWWNSTYTTYNDDANIAEMVDQAKAAAASAAMDSIPENIDQAGGALDRNPSSDTPINRS